MTLLGFFGYGYGMGMGYGFRWDPTFWLVILGMVLCLIAQGYVRSTFNKFAQYRTKRGITGDDVARRILSANGMGYVQVLHGGASLSDHFDPRSMTVSLSETVYGKGSIAAVAVAAHECGHVLQHRDKYGPYGLRTSLVPVVNAASSISWVMILIGIFMGGLSYEAERSDIGSLFIKIGIICFSLAVFFQIVTLPVEFNASRRAIAILASSGDFDQEEVYYARKVLNAAAMTYVAGAASSILQLLRLILISGRRR